jgi:hypothetical protein
VAVVEPVVVVSVEVVVDETEFVPAVDAGEVELTSTPEEHAAR